VRARLTSIDDTLAVAGRVLLLCLFPAVALAFSAPDTYLSYSGTANAPLTTTFLYGERHTLRYQGERIVERVVLYTCSDGSAFARKSVSYVDALAPDFLLEDVANGLREGIRSAAGSRSVFFRADRASAEQSAALPPVADLVADTGFDEYVRANWPQLLGEKPLPLRFLVPSRLKDYLFQAQHLRSVSLEGMPTEVFRLRLAGIGGWLLSGIDVYYSANEHVLVRYDGLSDLRDAAGANYQAQIDFRLSDRKPSDAQAMSDARQATLKACRNSPP
jgi:hypothetical protein